MSVPVIDAWLDNDGVHVWIEHRCADGRLVEAKLPHPQWSVGEGGTVLPSVHCTACGAHQFAKVRGGLTYE